MSVWWTSCGVKRSLLHASIEWVLPLRVLHYCWSVFLLLMLSVMLNEAKISRPRPGSRGRDRGQGFEVKAKANFLRSRPKPRPKIKLWIKVSDGDWQHTGEFISLWSKRHMQFNFSFSLSPQLPCVMSCSRQTDWSVSSWVLVLLLQTETKCLRPRPRPKVWSRDRGHNFGLEDLTSLEWQVMFFTLKP